MRKNLPAVTQWPDCRVAPRTMVVMNLTDCSCGNGFPRVRRLRSPVWPKWMLARHMTERRGAKVFVPMKGVCRDEISWLTRFDSAGGPRLRRQFGPCSVQRRLHHAIAAADAQFGSGPSPAGRIQRFKLDAW